MAPLTIEAELTQHTLAGNPSSGIEDEVVTAAELLDVLPGLTTPVAQ